MTTPLALINIYTERAPVDVEGLVLALGLNLTFTNLGSEVSGMIEKEGEKFNIIINENDSEKRKRFTIAHELGHYILHRDKIENGVEDDRAYRSLGLMGKYKNTKIGKKEESQANQFAATLLMPWNLIKTLKANGITDLSVLAEKLMVSQKVIKIRLGEYDNTSSTS